jgi:hypothetical protein
MDRQDELLEKEDGRYYAIDKVRTGLGSIATSEKLKKKIVHSVFHLDRRYSCIWLTAPTRKSKVSIHCSSLMNILRVFGQITKQPSSTSWRS